jgi:hypothetical protein
MGPQDPKNVTRDTACDSSTVVRVLAALKDVRQRSAIVDITLPCPTVGASMREGGVAFAKASTSNSAKRPVFLPVHGVVCGVPGVIRYASTSSRESSDRDTRPGY